MRKDGKGTGEQDQHMRRNRDRKERPSFRSHVHFRLAGESAGPGAAGDEPGRTVADERTEGSRASARVAAGGAVSEGLKRSTRRFENVPGRGWEELGGEIEREGMRLKTSDLTAPLNQSRQGRVLAWSQVVASGVEKKGWVNIRRGR